MNTNERTMLNRALRELRKAGWEPTAVFDGELFRRSGNGSPVIPAVIVTRLVDEVEDATIYFNNGPRGAWLRVVPDDCADATELFNDWSVVGGFADTLENLLDRCSPATPRL